MGSRNARHVVGREDAALGDQQGALGRQRGEAFLQLTAGIGRLNIALVSHLAALEASTWDSWEQATPGLKAYGGKARLYREGRAHYLTADTEQALAALDSSLQLPVQLYRRIKAGDLRKLFIEHLGWNRAAGCVALDVEGRAVVPEPTPTAASAPELSAQQKPGSTVETASRSCGERNLSNLYPRRI